MILTEQDLTALFVTLKLASVSTLVLLVVGTPLAWWLSKSQWRFKYLIEAIIALPSNLTAYSARLLSSCVYRPQWPNRGPR